MTEPLHNRARKALVEVMTSPIGKPIQQYLHREVLRDTVYNNGPNDAFLVGKREGRRNLAKELLRMGTPQAVSDEDADAERLEIIDREV